MERERGEGYRKGIGREKGEREGEGGGRERGEGGRRGERGGESGGLRESENPESQRVGEKGCCWHVRRDENKQNMLL